LGCEHPICFAGVDAAIDRVFSEANDFTPPPVLGVGYFAASSSITVFAPI
jgi:hypothetical protein